MTLLLVLLIGWILLSVPVTLVIGRGVHLATEREHERIVSRPVVELRVAEVERRRRAA